MNYPFLLYTFFWIIHKIQCDLNEISKKIAQIKEVRAKEDCPYHKISMGTEVKQGELPYQVALLGHFDNVFCGGAILDERTILTASHCFLDYLDDKKSTKTKMQFFVRAGSVDHKQGGVRVKGDKVHVNPQFFEFMKNSTLVADIAIFSLDEPLKFDDNIQPIDLIKHDPKVGEKAIVSGWGVKKNKDEEEPRILNKVELKVMDLDKCQKDLNASGTYIDKEENFCAGSSDDSKDACHGDSGGPLVIDKQLAGIVSFGVECGGKIPGVYSNVFKFKDWIDKKWQDLK